MCGILGKRRCSSNVFGIISCVCVFFIWNDHKDNSKISVEIPFSRKLIISLIVVANDQANNDQFIFFFTMKLFWWIVLQISGKKDDNFLVRRIKYIEWVYNKTHYFAIYTQDIINIDK